MASMGDRPFLEAVAQTSRPTLIGTFGMAASTHWLATASAQSVLERGGNAFDAAVAAGFVLHVVEPHLNGPGGDLVAIIAPADEDPRVLAGQGPAPAGASIAHFTREGLQLVPGSGALAAAVPAAVEAWLWLLEQHGTWQVADVLSYAIDYAASGHAAGRQLCSVIATMADHFAEHWPSSARTWLPQGAPPKPGDPITNPAYANTLRRLLEHASNAGEDRVAQIQAVRRAWRSGFVAETIASYASRPHMHSTGTAHAGVITAADFESLRIETESPLTLDFRGTVVVKPSFWTQGPVLLQTLAILDHFDAGQLDPSTGTGAHIIIEAIKLAMADRDSYYGHATGDASLMAELLSAEYAKERASLIGDRASTEYRPGRLLGCDPYLPPLMRADEGQDAAGVGEPTVRSTGQTRGDTCHVDIVDRFGNMVSATPSGGWLQSSPTVPGLGFCLGTRLQMTWLDEGSPSALRPGERPRTTLSPTMLLREGVPVAALGTPGGDQQDQWQLLYLLRVLVGGYSPQQAIDAPAFHTTAMVSSFWPRSWTPAGVVAEARLGDDVIAELTERGHRVTVSPDWSLGRLSTVTRDPSTGLLAAAANPRGGQGYAAGR